MPGLSPGLVSEEKGLVLTRDLLAATAAAARYFISPVPAVNLKEEEEDEAAWMFSLPGNVQ